MVKDYDYAMVRECVSQVAYIPNQSEQARRVGIETSTWGRWVGGDIATPLRATRTPVESFQELDGEQRASGRWIVSQAPWARRFLANRNIF